MLSKYKPFSLSFISPNNQKWLRRIILNSCVRDIFLYSFFQFHFLSFSIVIRNGKIVWKHGPCCWYFRLNLKYLRCPYRAYIKTEKNGDFCEKMLSENDIEAVLATFCYYDHGPKTSEAVQKIATDQKEYWKCSLRVIICWIVKIYLSINNTEKWLVTRIPPTQLKKLLKLYRKRSNNWPMVGFIHNGSEITTWMGHSFKIQNNIFR